MTTQKTKQSPIILIGGSLLCIAFGVYIFGGGLEHSAKKEVDRISNQVAADAVEQYNIAKRNGKSMDICVAAGTVSAAFLQAKDEANYAAWKKTEEADCVAAGLPKQ